MPTARKWQNMAIAMQSALAAAVTVTAITQANPGVATAAAHGYANGDVLIYSVQGMRELDMRVIRCAGVTTNTWQLEGIDTTLFQAFTSGTVQKITFGTTISTVTRINSGGGGFDFLDATTVHGNTKVQIPGLANAATYTMTNIWDVSDAGLLAMKTASDAQAMRAFRFQFGTGGQLMYFAGYVAANLLPGGEAQQLVTTDSAVTMFGSPTYYAS